MLILDTPGMEDGGLLMSIRSDLGVGQIANMVPACHMRSGLSLPYNIQRE